MSHRNAYIFDLDGTLYPFQGGATFGGSVFYRDIKKNVYRFLETVAGVPRENVEEYYGRLTAVHGGTGAAIERAFGIGREKYFAATWNLDPSTYVAFSDEPRQVLEQFCGRSAVLTAAPRVWAEAVLRHLNILDLVDGALFTCDSDVRKPSPEAFAHVGTFLGVPFDRIFSIGDQEESDIVPPKSIGMRTIRVGSSDTSADAHIHTLGELLTLSIDGKSVV